MFCDLLRFFDQKSRRKNQKKVISSKKYLTSSFPSFIPPVNLVCVKMRDYTKLWLYSLFIFSTLLTIFSYIRRMFGLSLSFV